MAMLHAVDDIESDEGVQITTTCNEMTVSMEPSIEETLPSMSAPSDAVPCPAFDGTDDERARLHTLLNQYAHGFTQDDLDLGYTEASPPSMMPQSLSPTGAYRQTSSRR